MLRKLYFLSVLALNSITNAADGTVGEAIPGGSDGVPQVELDVFITRITNGLLTIVGSIAVLFLIIGGLQYITSAGNPDSIGKAKSTILYSIIGLVVAILAYSVVNFVIGALTSAPPQPSHPTNLIP